MKKRLSVKKFFITFILSLSLILTIASAIVIMNALRFNETSNDIIDASTYKNEILQLEYAFDKLIFTYSLYITTGSKQQISYYYMYSEKLNTILEDLSNKGRGFPSSESASITTLLEDTIFFYLNNTREDASKMSFWIDEYAEAFRFKIINRVNEEIHDKLERDTEMLGNIRNMQFASSVFVLVLIFLFLIITIPLIGSVVRDLNKVSSSLESAVKKKNLGVKFDQNSSFYEISEINQSSHSFISIIIKMLKDYSRTSDEIDAFAAKLDEDADNAMTVTENAESAVVSISKDISDMKKGSDTLSKNILTLMNMFNKNAKFLEKTKSESWKFKELMHEQYGLVDSLGNSHVLLESSIIKTMDFMKLFESELKGIEKSIEKIDKIHKKIEILSLNAAIEAAKNSEKGGGFAVIADEIGKLSARSSESSKEIQNTMTVFKTKAKDLNMLIMKAFDSFIALKEDWSMIRTVVNKVDSTSTESFKETEKLISDVNNISGIFEEMFALFVTTKENIDGIAVYSEQVAVSTAEAKSKMGKIAFSSKELVFMTSKMKNYAEDFNI